MNDLTHAAWHKSGRSGGGGECVEVAQLSDGDHAIRDSKNPTGPALRCAPTAWAIFTTSIRDGKFD